MSIDNPLNVPPSADHSELAIEATHTALLLALIAAIVILAKAGLLLHSDTTALLGGVIGHVGTYASIRSPRR